MIPFRLLKMAKRHLEQVWGDVEEVQALTNEYRVCEEDGDTFVVEHDKGIHSIFVQNGFMHDENCIFSWDGDGSLHLITKHSYGFSDVKIPARVKRMSALRSYFPDMQYAESAFIPKP
jgi:hypothetical protein